MIPELPELPPFPELHWGYENGKYWIGEDDADRLLDYGENQIPMYRWEMERYQKELTIIIEYAHQ